MILWPAVALIGFLILIGFVIAMGASTTARYEQECRRTAETPAARQLPAEAVRA